MTNIKIQAVLVAGLLGMSAQSMAATIDQWATNVINYSSQWSSGGWSATQALGAPNTFGYGDISTAWAPDTRDGSQENITLGFDIPVYATGATIRETLGNGFVYKIDLLDTKNVLHTVWNEVDSSLPGTPVDFNVNWSPTGFLTQGIKIYVNTNHSGTWEEIDAVQLHGTDTAVVPLPAAAWLFVSSLLGLVGFGYRGISVS